MKIDKVYGIYIELNKLHISLSPILTVFAGFIIIGIAFLIAVIGMSMVRVGWYFLWVKP